MKNASVATRPERQTKSHPIGPKSTSMPLSDSEPCLDCARSADDNLEEFLQYERTPEEVAYWEAFKNGGDMNGLKAPPMVIAPDMTAWDKFNFDAHPDLLEAKKALVEWYNERLQGGYSIILAGRCGCGKTHLAKAVRDIHIMRVKYWTEIELIKGIQDSFKNPNVKSKAEIVFEINRSELFIYDDLGAYETDNTDWMHTIYMDLFDTRCDAKKPFLVTTNLTKVELIARVGERVASRIVGALDEKRFYVDLFKVPDYRMKNFG